MPLAGCAADPHGRPEPCHRFVIGPIEGTLLPRLNMHAAKALSYCDWIEVLAFEVLRAANPAPPSAPAAAPIPAPWPPPIAAPSPAPRAVVSAAVPRPRKLAPWA